MGTADLRDFFDRLATGDYHALAKELNIPKPVLPQPPAPTTPLRAPTTPLRTPPRPSPDSPGDISLDSLDGYTFEPTVEGLERAVALLPGLAQGFGAPSPSKRGPGDDAAAEEAFQFTFRLMIHKLYTIRDFAAMVDDVVRTSQARFQPLPPALTSRSRRRYGSLAGAYPYARDDGESFMSAGSFASPSAPTLPSSPSLQSVDHLSDVFREHDEDVRALKKRCIGRRMALADPNAGSEHDAASGPQDGNVKNGGRGVGWVYDSAVAAVESPAYAAFVAGLPPLSPLSESPSRYGYGGAADDQGDGSSRKRRFSLLAARGF
ncbi:hypothetical protein C2E23DRAFT_730155 [Lenzites betulinus]|nr:hypothetical protein C2E23DRAFT_730155 [Lenzites betulinus]